ncbi:MAG: ABC transporter permease [Pseudomonadota bacterium]
MGLFRYFLDIVSVRYFWMHLVIADLRASWRNSYLGILWPILQPLAMTFLVAFVLGSMFHVPVREYAPYIFSGTLVWEFILKTAIGGSLAYVQAEPYIKQFRHPLAIYTLRTSLFHIAVMMLGFAGLVIWSLVVLPENFGLPWLAILLLFPVLLFSGWALASIFSYTGVIYRDLPHALGIVFQAVWFVSPVYFLPGQFRDGGVGWLVDYNPIYHVLQLIRAPLLNGQWPIAENLVFSLATVVVLCLGAIFVGYRQEPKVIFYL